MVEDHARFFKALGEDTRLLLVRSLFGVERCACEFSLFSNRDQTTISRHLKVLVDAGILKSRKAGRYVFYSIKNEKIEAALGQFGLKPLAGHFGGCSDENRESEECCPKEVQ